MPSASAARLDVLRRCARTDAGGAIGREALEGSLEAGKRADLIALSDDVFTCAEARIPDVAPVLSLVGGDLVYDAR